VERLHQIRRHFEARAARYDNPLTAFIGERELRQVRPYVPAGSRVLDYGCGTGRTTLDLLRRGCQVTAYDLAPAMLHMAEQRAQRAGLAAEFTAEPEAFRGRQWPIVTCIGVLDYYADPLPLLRQLRQHVAPGGRLVATYPNACSPLGWLYVLGARFRLRVYARSPAAARAAAGAAGLRLQAIRHAFPALPPLGHTLIVVHSTP
jgi:2-polyprenyl-3-methyl-5-hydroxy-6-metoxy-1,4-benzoquinol methylase